MNLLSLIFMTLLVTAQARRWRFCTPFPGKIENSMPESTHNAFDDLQQKEELYDVKQISYSSKRTKIKLDDEDADGRLKQPAPLLFGPEEKTKTS